MGYTVYNIFIQLYFLIFIHVASIGSRTYRISCPASQGKNRSSRKIE